MTYNYGRARATATRAIKDKGTRAILSKLGSSSGSPYRPTFTQEFFLLYVLDFEQRLTDRTGSLIGESVRTLYVAAEGIIPEKGDSVKLIPADFDLVVDNSNVVDIEVSAFTDAHEILDVRTLAPGGIAVMFECDIAR